MSFISFEKMNLSVNLKYQYSSLFLIELIMLLSSFGHSFATKKYSHPIFTYRLKCCLIYRSFRIVLNISSFLIFIFR